MDMRQLRYFVTVADEGSISRAAQCLHISQPPLTRQIQQLEQQVGAPLFERTPKGVQLTNAGRYLLEDARVILNLADQAAERAQLAAQGLWGRFDIAIFGSGVLDTIPELLLKFRSACPGVRVFLHTMGKNEQIEALRQRRISLGFNRLIKKMPDISVELVKNERLLLAVPTSTTLARQEAIAIPDLAGQAMILFPSHSRPNFIDYVHALCHENGFYPDVAQEVGDTATGVALVAAGLGVCLVPESAANLQIRGVTYRELSQPNPPSVDLSCIYRKNDLSPTLHAFLKVMREYRESSR